MRKCCNNIEELKNNPRLYLIVTDLVARCVKIEDIAITNNETIVEFLNKRKGLVTEEQLFDKYAESLLYDKLKEYNLELKYGRNNNRKGNIFLAYSYIKEWCGAEIDEPINSNKKCRFIHVELAMAQNTDYIKFCIHYETPSYKSRSEMKEIEKKLPQNVREYEKNRNIFKNNLYNVLGNDWKKIGKCITLVEKKISKDTDFSQLKKWAEKNSAEAYLTINKCLKLEE